jgi:ubiquitin C-terminal hydrolase
MNSVFQALRHSPEFLQIFWKPFVHYDKKGEAVSKALHTLMTTILAAKSPVMFPTLPGVVDSRPFVRSLLTSIAADRGLEYRYGEQLDSSEFLQFLLDTVHTYLSKRVVMEITGGSGDVAIVSAQRRALESWKTYYEREYSPMVEHFFGQTHNTTICMNCKKQTSESFEPWCKIEASIPNSNIHGAPAPTLLKCLEHSFSEEVIEDYACESCHVRSSCKKTHRVTRFPTNLIIVLKRFTNTGGKVSGGIPWDLHSLDLSGLYAFQSPFKTPPPIYKTYAVIEHHGLTGGGHYFMRARQGAQWVEYNDSSVREIPEHMVITNYSYIIFATLSDSYNSFHAESYPAYQAQAEALLVGGTAIPMGGAGGPAPAAAPAAATPAAPATPATPAATPAAAPAAVIDVISSLLNVTSISGNAISSTGTPPV